MTNDQTETKKKFPTTSMLLIVAALIVGFIGGQFKIQVEQGDLKINRGTPPQNADYSLLWDALDKLNSKYVDRPLDQQKLMYGAVAGMVNAAGDPYTTFFDPEQSKEFEQALQGAFDGIGAEIGIKNNQLMIVSPLENSPALRAGLQPEDAILGINGESTVGLTVDEAVTKIRGPSGTEVTLTILHKGQQSPVEVKITRARIEIKSVEFETREINGKKIAVIQLNRFGEDTKGLLDHSIDQILAGNYSGVILDVRNNPGGYLDVAVTTASNWVNSGEVVVREVGFGGTDKSYNARGNARLKDVKTVVLVNGGSASASEIVAGALQDYKLATVVGEKTFGKGSVQEVIDLRDSTIKITTAKWHTPNNRNIDKNGLEPDVTVELTREDVAAERDPQMDKALDLLK